MKIYRLAGAAALSLVAVTVVSTAKAAGSSGFPSNKVLRQSNVSIAATGFEFDGGISKDSSGNFTGDGLEVEDIKWWGSGFIAKSDGTLVTNYHVASKALEMVAIFDTGARYDIKHIKVYNPDTDLAVLTIEGRNKFTPVTLGNSDAVEPQDEVMAVGNSKGVGMNITKGEVSQVVHDDNRHPVALRHTAAIAGGNSGGALYKGHKVVGVNEATWPGTQFSVAVPINEVKPLLSSRYHPHLLRRVFSASSIKDKLRAITSFSNTAPAATGIDKPGLLESQEFQLSGLEDYVFILQSPENTDLNLAVLGCHKDCPAQMRVIGLGTSQTKGQEIIAKSLEYDTRAQLVVYNPYKTPVNFAISVYEIEW